MLFRGSIALKCYRGTIKNKREVAGVGIRLYAIAPSWPSKAQYGFITSHPHSTPGLSAAHAYAMGLPLTALRSLICLGLLSEGGLQSQKFRLHLITHFLRLDHLDCSDLVHTFHLHLRKCVFKKERMHSTNPALYATIQRFTFMTMLMLYLSY